MPLKSAGEVWYLLQSDCCNWGHLEKADQLNNRKITNTVYISRKLVVKHIPYLCEYVANLELAPTLKAEKVNKPLISAHSLSPHTSPKLNTY